MLHVIYSVAPVQRPMFLLGKRGCLQAPPGFTAQAAVPGLA